MRVFVTGGTGFIGSHFLNQALDAGHEVLALRRTGSQPRVPLRREPQWLEASFAQLEAEHFAGVEAVVHLASHSANVPYDDLETCLYWNVAVPLRMAERAFRAGVRRFVVAGSCFEYGRSGERYELIPTDAPLEPTQSYPISKAAASIAWQGFARERNSSVCLLRLFQVYGEGEPASRMWPSLRVAAKAGRDFPMTAGEQVRDFVEVGEVARAFLHALSRALAAGKPEVFHVGSGRPQTIREFAEHWWREWGAKGKLQIGALPYRTGEVMRFVPHIERVVS